MINNLKVLAIIPARGASKRIPHKNIKILCGKPLIEYTIDAAKKSMYIDRIITSTDDEATAKIALRAGSEIPFMRPPELSGDVVTDFPVFLHALNWLMEHESYKPDIVVQLRPTSPMRTTEHIDEAIKILVTDPSADSVRTVTVTEQSPYKMYEIDGEGLLKPIITLDNNTESFNLPNQILPVIYKHVGYVDVVRAEIITKKKKMTGSRIIPLVIEKAYSGINTLQDWDYYEYLLNKQK
jgi:N-acylneuraminate cytidylyltransferase